MVNRSPPPPASLEEPQPTPSRNLFLSPFSSAPPVDEVAEAQEVFQSNPSWATSPRRTGRTRGDAGGADAVEPECGGEDDGRREQGAKTPSHQKGSHAKLDLLLNEVQRLNGRLDMLAGRLGGLGEEEPAEIAEVKLPS